MDGSTGAEELPPSVDGSAAEGASAVGVSSSALSCSVIGASAAMLSNALRLRGRHHPVGIAGRRLPRHRHEDDASGADSGDPLPQRAAQVRDPGSGPGSTVSAEVVASRKE